MAGVIVTDKLIDTDENGKKCTDDNGKKCTSIDCFQIYTERMCVKSSIELYTKIWDGNWT